jgi:pSer/pThr/pTyr-binding forkhead associated (FHA) protein
VAYRLVVCCVARRSGEEHAFDLDRDVVLVGRRAGVDVPLPHPSIEGVHLRLERRDGKVYAIEPGAGLDIQVNGRRLSLREQQGLSDGDELVLAQVFRLRYVALSHAEPTTPDGTAALARAMVHDVLSALGKAHPDTAPTLVVTQGNDEGRVISLPLPGRDLVLGRGETCDAMIVDPDLSREHARLCRTWSACTIEDLGSKNGTFVGEARLVTGRPQVLVHGARIRVGSQTLELRDPADEYLREVTVIVPAPPEPLPAVAPALAPESQEPDASLPPAPTEDSSRKPSLSLRWLRVCLALLVIGGAVAALIFLFSAWS